MSRPRYAEGYEGVFGLMEFPQYTFQEYPKWITTTMGPKLVKDRREELELLAFTTAKVPTAEDVKDLSAAAEQAQAALAEKNEEIERLQKQLADALAAQVATQTGQSTAAPIPAASPAVSPTANASTASTAPAVTLKKG